MHLLYGQRGVLDTELFRKWMRRNLVESARALCKMALEKELVMNDFFFFETEKAWVMGIPEEGENMTAEDGTRLSALWRSGPLERAFALNRAEPTHCNASRGARARRVPHITCRQRAACVAT